MKKTTCKQKRWAIKYLRARKVKAAKMLLAYSLENILIYDKNNLFEFINYKDIDHEKFLAGGYTSATVLLRADDITYSYGVKRILNSEDKSQREYWQLFKAWFYVLEYLKVGLPQYPCHNAVVNDILQLVSILFMKYMLIWLDYRDAEMKQDQHVIDFIDFIRDEIIFCNEIRNPAD